MPITLAKMASNTASININWGEDTVAVVYYPSKITERVFAQLQSFAGLTKDTVIEGFGTLNEMLAGLVKSWDVLEDDGVTMFPLDPARMADLPLLFRTGLIQAIMNDTRPETLAPQGKMLS